MRIVNMLSAFAQFVISRASRRDYLSAQEAVASAPAMGIVRMRRINNWIFVAGLMALAPAMAQADDFKLSQNQRISCSRGLSPGKLSTATCRSYAYLFNAKTSDYFRCSVSVSMTRDTKEIINVQSDGGCSKKARIFDTDGSYSFDVAETEPPNTNSFFGSGGVVLWASDNSQQKLRACVTIPSGIGPDVSRCVDMKFE
jgi:hypothetical protein